MPGISDYAENKLLGLVVGAVAYARPANVYLDLYTVAPGDDGTGGTVVPTSNGYPGRTAIANNATNFPAASGGVKSNGVDITIGTPTGAGWGTVVGVGMWDASSGGNFLGYFDLGTDKACVAGKRVKILATVLQLSLSGAWSTALANAVLDHLLGGGDYTPAATLYYGLLAAGSAELTETGYARVGKTNNTTEFPAVSGGATSNGTDVVFGPATEDWTEAVSVGLFSASSGGTPIMTAALDTPVDVLDTETTTFDAGSFDLSLA